MMGLRVCHAFFFWTAAIAGNECKKGFTQECVDVNAAGELIVNDFSFRVV